MNERKSVDDLPGTVGETDKKNRTRIDKTSNTYQCHAMLVQGVQKRKAKSHPLGLSIALCATKGRENETIVCGNPKAI